MRTQRLSLPPIGLVPLMCVLSPSGLAQETDEAEITQIEEIVVTGSFQRSLQDALTEKRNADEIIEALSAEDIGELPDTSVAESLARLPGVAHTRNAFGANNISIRGLGSILTSATLNDRDLASEWGDRSVSFNMFPAELISRATVYKAPSASHVEGGIGGTINLQTARALDWGERYVGFNVSGRHNDLGGDLPNGEARGYRGSASYVDQYADDTVGIALAYAGQFAPLVSASSYIYEWRTVDFEGYAGELPYEIVSINGINIPYGGETNVTTGTFDRHSVLGTLQWRPIGSFEVSFDGFFSSLAQVGSAVGLGLGGPGSYRQRGDGAIIFGNEYRNVEFDGFNLIGATVTCARATVNDCLERGAGQDLSAVNSVDNADGELHSYGVDGNWTAGSMTLSYDFSYSRAYGTNEYATVHYRPYLGAGDFLRLLMRPIATFGENDASAGYVISPLDFTDLSTNRIDAFNVIEGTREDEVFTYKSDVEYALDSSFFSALAVGIRLVNRDNTLDYRRTRMTPGEVGLPRLIDPTFVSGTFDQSQTHADFDANPVLILDAQGIRDTVFPGIQAQTQPSSGHFIEEDVLAYYAQADFQTDDHFRVPASGNFGFRVVTTDVDTMGTSSVDGVVVPVETSDTYTEILPSANINFFVRDDFIVRLAAARVISRPALNFLSPGTDSYRGVVYGGANGGGNPFLRPFIADQVDLSFEKYFDSDTALAVALFAKEMDTFITQARIESGPPDNTISFVPSNGTGGYVVGVEATFQHTFLNLLPGGAGDVGIYATYSYTDSNIELSETFNSSRFSLDGQSDHVGNVTVHYFRNNFGARLSYRYRSEFTRPQRPARAFTTNRGEGDLSFQVSFEPNDRLSIFVEGWNLLDEPRDNFYGLDSLQGAYSVFGRNFQLGASYRP